MRVWSLTTVERPTVRRDGSIGMKEVRNGVGGIRLTRDKMEDTQEGVLEDGGLVERYVGDQSQSEVLGV